MVPSPGGDSATARPTRTSGSPVATERKGERTRRRILHAARGRFAEAGYERATIRAIAADANVDKSAVMQYFGSKEALFREAVAWDIPMAEMSVADPAASVHNYLSGMLDAWAADPHSPMAVLLRTSMTSQDAAELLRTHITAQAVDPMAARIDADDARLRAALAGAMMMGIASQRYLLAMPDLAAASTEDILRLAVPVLSSLLDTDGQSPPGHATGE
ncbi:TetR/AcrR family transcriptional regulator [Streptomyces sp. NPDC002690]